MSKIFFGNERSVIRIWRKCIAGRWHRQRSGYAAVDQVTLRLNLGFCWRMYKVVHIWPGLIVCKLVTVCPSHIWTTLYNYLPPPKCVVLFLSHPICMLSRLNIHKCPTTKIVPAIFNFNIPFCFVISLSSLLGMTVFCTLHINLHFITTRFDIRWIITR